MEDKQLFSPKTGGKYSTGSTNLPLQLKHQKYAH
jgi:hypothetical protein